METYLTLTTQFGENLKEDAWSSYPRPQMKRDSFLNLNGQWELAINTGETLPEQYDRKIIVPYPIESLLSGIGEQYQESYHLFYRKTFILEKDFIKDKIILHFGAVDQVATVFVNGYNVGKHLGGYSHFEFDITQYITIGDNVLEVMVFDFLSWHVLPYGKQTTKRGGMWYTPISGIWQTVWIESVNDEYIESIKINTKQNHVSISITPAIDGTITLKDNKGKYLINNGICQFDVNEAKYWSPENPYLYYFDINTKKDKVESYFGLRDLEIKEIDGYKRLCLNGKPYFFNGLLDQGYWPDGLFTPASEESFDLDILTMKKLGYNVLRKHIKIEPDYFYYACDRLGMIVFQDFVNNSRYSFIKDSALPTIGIKKLNDKNFHNSPLSRRYFIDGMKDTVNQLYNFPSICYWTIFNEGWGQFDSDNVYKQLKELDSSRFIDSTSGWFFNKESDVHSEHCYFKPFKMVKSDKPIVLSEFGGYVYKDLDHSFNQSKTYGYKIINNQKEFQDQLIQLYNHDVIENIPKGLCGAIYTQVSDVEDETNGLFTYDRKVLKVDIEMMLEINKKCKI